jgi:hypothetical protein
MSFTVQAYADTATTVTVRLSDLTDWAKLCDCRVPFVYHIACRHICAVLSQHTVLSDATATLPRHRIMPEHIVDKKLTMVGLHELFTAIDGCPAAATAHLTRSDLRPPMWLALDDDGDVIEEEEPAARVKKLHTQGKNKRIKNFGADEMAEAIKKRAVAAGSGSCAWGAGGGGGWRGTRVGDWACAFRNPCGLRVCVCACTVLVYMWRRCVCRGRAVVCRDKVLCVVLVWLCRCVHDCSLPHNCWYFCAFMHAHTGARGVPAGTTRLCNACGGPGHYSKTCRATLGGTLSAPAKEASKVVTDPSTVVPAQEVTPAPVVPMPTAASTDPAVLAHWNGAQAGTAAAQDAHLGLPFSQQLENSTFSQLAPTLSGIFNHLLNW